jgi:NurA domain
MFDCQMRTMHYDPVQLLVEDLVSRIKEQGTGKSIFSNDNSERFELSPEKFQQIKITKEKRKIAFVDGGSSELLKAPNYSIQFNRVYFSIFDGNKRLIPQKTTNKIEFFSYVFSTIKQMDLKKEIYFNVNLWSIDKISNEKLPNPDDLSFDSTDSRITEGNQRPDLARVASIARRFAEWKMAIEAVKNELSAGDILVIDGSLQEAFQNESKYTGELYDLAESKGIIICGLSKTSRLYTDSGASLLGAVKQISNQVDFERWFIKVGTQRKDDRGLIMVVKLHPNSEFVFRLEILQNQLEKMTPDELNSILSALSSNSSDLSMIGYPYGLIDADAYSRVKFNELSFYKDIILSYLSKETNWKQVIDHTVAIRGHYDLNLAV